MANTTTTTDGFVDETEKRLNRIRAANAPNQVSVVDSKNTPARIGTPFVYSSQGVFSAGVIYESSFIVDLLLAFNASASDVYFQLFDKEAPVAGDVPAIPFVVPAGQQLSWSGSQDGRVFPSACSFAVSSTLATYTPVAAPFWVDVEGRILPA